MRPRSTPGPMSPTRPPAARLAGPIVLACAVLPFAAACGSAPSVTLISAAPCPAHNPGLPAAHARQAGAARLVPGGQPVVVTVCGYSASGRPAGSLVLRSGASALATELNRLRHVSKPINFMCVHRPGGAVLLRFGYATGPGADVLVQGSDCRFASNGDFLAYTTSALQARLAALASSR